MKRKFLATLLLSSLVCLTACSLNTKKTDNDDKKNADVTATTTPEPSAELSVPEGNTPETPEPTPEVTVSPDPGLSGIFDEEVNNQTYNASPVTFVVKGVQYTSPSDYLVRYGDDIGPIVYMTNVFQMKMVRKDETFDNVVSNIAELDDKAINGGAKSLKEPTTVKIGDKSFAYFIVDIDHEKTLGVLTKSPDGKFCIGGQIVIMSDKVSDENILNMFAGIAATASVTDKADSTKAEIDAQIKFITGEKRTSSTIKYKEASLTYKVPDGCYFTAETDGATSFSQFYSSADLEIYVSIEEKAFADDTAEYSIDCSVQYEENAVKLVEEIGGNKVYICTSHYTNDNGKEYYDITAKSDIDKQFTYCVSANWVDKGDIPFDSIRRFFEFEGK